MEDQPGEDIIYASKQMGHANPSITANVYAHLIRAKRPEAAAKTDALLFPIVGRQAAAASTAVH